MRPGLTGDQLTVVISPPGQERGQVVESSEVGSQGDTLGLQHCQHSLHLLPGDLVLVLEEGLHLHLLPVMSRLPRLTEAEEVVVEAGLTLSEL